MKVLHFPAQRIALVLVFALLNQTFFPTIAWALTSGPTQQEVSSFTPASTSDMVDLFSGDFQYNIPLLDVGGYPINISYAAGPGMDEEASWVGLGWNLNPGVINRQMRGIPDYFRGDTIYKAFNMRPAATTGFPVGGGWGRYHRPFGARQVRDRYVWWAWQRLVPAVRFLLDPPGRALQHRFPRGVAH